MDELQTSIVAKWQEKSQEYVSKGDNLNAQRCVAVANLLGSQPHETAIAYINNEISKIDYRDKKYAHAPLRILEEALTDAYKLQQNHGKSTFYSIISTGRAVPQSDTRRQRYGRGKR